MKVPTATRRIQFCAGHRVMGHENKCAHLHGHNYTALLTARPTISHLSKTNSETGLDGVGRVIDFSVLKERLGAWIDKYWDHGFILHEQDSAMINAFVNISNAISSGQKMAVLPYNPTAENMARYLLEVVGPKVLPPHIELCHVRIWETPNCYADAALDDHQLVIVTPDGAPQELESGSSPESELSLDDE